MAITSVGTLTSVRITTGTTQSFTLAPGAVNNLIVLNINWTTTAVNVNSIVTASNGILWRQWTLGKLITTTLTGSPAVECWLGVAQSTSSQITNITYSAAITSARYDFQEFHSSLATPVWSETSSASVLAGAGTALTGGSLNAIAGDVAWDLFICANTGSSTIAGTGWTTPGVLDGATNIGCFNLNCAGGSTFPTGTQSSSGSNA